MTTPFKIRMVRPARQRGAAAVEFALVAAFGGLLIALFGAIELGRVMFYLNTANEATRLGARTAAVCNLNDPLIKSRMMTMLSILNTNNIAVSYEPAGCDSSAENARNTCETVSVSLQDLQINTFVPFVPINVVMPPFTTTLPREAMDTSGCA